MKPLGVIVMATGRSDIYHNYAYELINSLRHMFPAHEVLLFTDRNPQINAIKIPLADLGWPRASLMRYHVMLKEEARLREYSQLLFMDADMVPVVRISMEELRTNGLLAVIHPGYPPNAYCTDPRSTSCVLQSRHPYFQGCLQGGGTDAYLRACHAIAAAIDDDDANGIVASNYDESHWNRYLQDHPPSLMLNGGYAFPGARYIRNDNAWPRMKSVQPRIRHIDKGLSNRVW